jgi:hypothetical protein
VQYGIRATFQDIEYVSKRNLDMKNTVKVALSALVAAPAVAKSRTQQSAPAQTYSQQGGVYGDNHNLGTDPDSRVRSEILRDGNAAYD